VTAQGSTKNQRLVLYLSPRALELLGSEADRRTRAAGVEVSAEGAARALVYQAMGLAPGGRAEAEGGADVDVEALSAAVSKLEAAARSLPGKGALSAEQGASLARALSGLAADMRQAMKEASDE
jgi:hypothetical protein